MTINLQIVEKMILQIAEFFHSMAANEQRRLYYMMPPKSSFPYAYQHSSIRDVATICNILDLVHFFKERQMMLGAGVMAVFEEVVGNTLQKYHELYQKNKVLDLPDGNIGDIGFFLLALEKCSQVFPSKLPDLWKTTRAQLVNRLLRRQNEDGSMRLFFDSRLTVYEKSAEAFYLPEALIGLIATLGHHSKEIDNQIITLIQRAILYCCQDENRERNVTSDIVTFYANWQFQLFYHWIYNQSKGENEISLEVEHLKRLINALMNSPIAKIPFEHNVATVEIACYLEGLVVHARDVISFVKIALHLPKDWFEKEINRCIHFLYQLQTATQLTIKGGFVHTPNSPEARVDVAGHVFNALAKLSRDQH